MFTGTHARQFAWCRHERNRHTFKYWIHDVIFTWEFSNCSICVGIKLPLSCTVFIHCMLFFSHKFWHRHHIVYICCVLWQFCIRLYVVYMLSQFLPILYSGKVWQWKSLANWLFSSIWQKKVWWINRSANKLLIVSIYLNGFILANHGQFAKFTKHSPAKLSRYTIGTVAIHEILYSAKCIVCCYMIHYCKDWSDTMKFFAPIWR